MTATALVFPGQGSQRPGMAAPWRGHPAYARWEEAAAALGWDVVRLGTDATADELRDPLACQVALYTHHAVLLEAWRSLEPARPMAVAGHSLGEYDALLAAGVLGFVDGLRLVEARARLTQEAARRAPGGMVACLGVDAELVAAAAAEAGAHMANDNAPGQLVVAGSERALQRLDASLSGSRGRMVRLEVGAAYHSPHMESAVEPFTSVLRRAPFADAVTPVVTNLDAAPHTDAAGWPLLLARQLTAPVRWRQTVHTLAAMGVTDVVELGASAVLSGMIKRTVPNLRRLSVSTPADLTASEVLT